MSLLNFFFPKKLPPIPGVTESKFKCVRDGLTIGGTEYRPAGENLPIAICSHGFMANQESVRQYARLLATLGYAAYCYDFNGGSVGRSASQGKTTDMSVLTEVKDLEAVIAYARSRSYTSDSVLLMGASQGGFVSALTAAKPENQIEKLILFYPAFCIPDDARAGKMMFSKFDPNNIPEIIKCGPMKLGRCYAADVIGMKEFELIQGYHGPVLIVHGTDDKIVNISYAHKANDAYLAACGDANVTFKIIPEGAHGFSKEHDELAKGYITEFVQ